MKRILTKLALSFFMVVLGQELLAADYYFSSVSGNDSRTAAQAQDPNTPWKSIEKLNAVFNTLKAGDVVYFKRGEVFYGTININKSGAAGNPIKISAYGTGAKPVITSLVTISGWKSLGGGKYESTGALNASDVSILLMNNKLQELGRFPNSDAANEGYLTIDAVSGTKMITSKGLAGSPNWNGGAVVIKKNQWIIDTQKITSHSGNSLGFVNGSTYPPKAEWGFFIQNHLNTLDKAGEWYFNTSSKKMNVYLGSQNPSSHKIEASTLDRLLTKTYAASHIHMDNLHFKGSNLDAVYVAGGKDIRFSNIEVENAGADGIQSLSVLELVIENSKVTNAYNNGLSLNYGNIGAILRNNVVENVGSVPGRNRNGDSNGIGILAKTDNTLVEGNTVRNTGYIGIHFAGNNTVVKNNFIENFVLTKGDGGGIYSFDPSSTSKYTNRKVINNIVLNARGSWGGVPQHGQGFKPLAEGIFLDDNSSGVEIAGNTVAHAGNSAMKMSNVSDIIIRDNTFFDASSLLNIGNNELGRDARNVTVQNNVFFSKYSDQGSYSLVTSKNDISQLGSFNGNYFFRPLGDEFSIYTRYQGPSGMVEKEEDLGRWKKSYGKDQESKSHTVAIEKFKVTGNVGANLFGNGSFATNIAGTNSSGGQVSWSSNKIQGGSLQMVTPKSSSITIPIGGIKGGKTYLVKFKGLANKEGAIKTHFRYYKAPWESVSPSTTFTFNTTQSEYQTILTPSHDVESAVLRIATDDPNFTFWMDDLEIREVQVEAVNPDEVILFEYNASSSPKSIKLNGTYVDAKNKQYTGSVTIAPYGSVVLVKTSSEGVKEEVKAPVPSVQLLLPSGSTDFSEGESLDLKADVEANGVAISKVNFYNGLKLIGSSTKSPYQMVWNNIPQGKHYVWASAIDSKGKEINSQEIDIEVSAAKTTAPAKESGLLETALPVAGMFFNTTANDTYIYRSKEFGKIPAGHLKTDGTNVATHTTASSDNLFHKSRFASRISYAIPLPNGTYSVETYHIETYYGQSGRTQKAGQRVFDISLEGKLVKDNFDMFLENGNKETVLTFKNIVVKDGILNLDMVASANNVTISGISVISYDGAEAIETSPSLTSLNFNMTNSAEISSHGKKFHNLPSNNLKTSGTNVATHITASNNKLFHKSRFADRISYAIPVPNGTYIVETYHIETYYGQSGRAQKAGQRVFDISLEGTLVKDNFDMFLENGNKETVLTFKNIVVKDGILNIDMAASANNVTISGIAVKGIPSGNTANLRTTSPEVDQVAEEKEALNEVGEDKIMLYPNPATSKTTLAVNVEVSSIIIHNMNGQMISNLDPQMLKSDRGKYIIPLSNMSQGLYMVTLVGNNGMIDQLRLLVNP